MAIDVTLGLGERKEAEPNTEIQAHLSNLVGSILLLVLLSRFVPKMFYNLRYMLM